MILKQMTDDGHGKVSVFCVGSVCAFDGKPAVTESKDEKGRLRLDFCLTTDSMRITDEGGNFVRWSYSYANVSLYYNASKASIYEACKKLEARQTIAVAGSCYYKTRRDENSAIFKTILIYADAVINIDALSLMLLGTTAKEFVALSTRDKTIELGEEYTPSKDEYAFD